MGWGYNEKVREKLKILGRDGQEVPNSKLAEALDLVFDADKRPMYRVLSDLRKHGEIKRCRPGVYLYIGLAKTEDELRKKIWRVIRNLKVVTINDLIELTGASKTYAKDYIQMLGRREIVKAIKLTKGRWKYQLINDPVIMPKNEDNAEKLRELRKKKKGRALAALVVASRAIEHAKKTIEEIDEGE